MYCHAEIVRALILAGADKDKKTHDGLHVGGADKDKDKDMANNDGTTSCLAHGHAEIVGPDIGRGGQGQVKFNLKI